MANPLFPTATAAKVAGLWHSNYTLADEGSYYMATSVTAAAGNAAGTGIATTTSVVDDAATASATHAQNVPVMYMLNQNAASDPNARTIYLSYLKMLVTAVPTSATFWNYLFRADSTQRYTSGGTTIVPTNLNPGSSLRSGALVIFGAVLTTPLPSTNARVLSSGAVQSSIPVAKDLWIFTFGDVVAPTNILTATGAKNITIPCGPVIIPPQWTIVLEMWGASNAAAPAWEFELGYVERVSGQ